VLLLLVVLTASLVPWGNPNGPSRDQSWWAALLSRLQGHPPELTIERPDVLVVSGEASDRFSVTTTVEPLGYTVLIASSVESGVRELSRQCDQIGIVVLDTALPNAQQLATARKAACPEAYLVPLKEGSRQPAQVAGLLMAALDVRLDAGQKLATGLLEEQKRTAGLGATIARADVAGLDELRGPRTAMLLSVVYMMTFVILFDGMHLRNRHQRRVALLQKVLAGERRQL
jgi:CheY-like chemotaxis protein